MSDSVLKLDASFRPIEMISWFDYVLLYLRGKATLVEVVPDEYYSSPSTDVPKALVIQVHHYVKLKDTPGNHNALKSVLFLRDEGKCQYCSKELSFRTATRDHVIPKSRAESLGMYKDKVNSYENQVICCRECNHKKADKLPWEVKMYPIKTPKKPRYVPTTVRGVKAKLQRQYVDAWYRTKLDPNAPADRYM